MIHKEWSLLTKIDGEFKASLIQGLLQASEIPTQLIQEGAGRAYGLTVGPLGEVEIYVPTDRLEESKAILDEYEAGDLD
jgi:hypothetical protein